MFRLFSSPLGPGFHTSEWPKRTARLGFCPPGARLAPVWGELAHASPPKRGPKMGLEWVKSDSSQNHPGPLGVPVHFWFCTFLFFFLAHLGAYLGRFESLYAPKSLKGEPFWDRKVF